MKVLVVKVSALGDVVHALPVLAWLKSVDRHIEIDWLVEETFAPLIQGHPLLRKVRCLATRTWRRQGWLSVIRATLRVAGDLRRERYDVVLDLQGNSKSGLFTLLCGAPARYGFAKNGVREWPNLLATNRRVTLTAADYHISDRSVAIARKAFPGGSEHPPAGPLPVSADARARVQRQLAAMGLGGQDFAVLHYGTTWPTKLWAVEQWQELVRILVAGGQLIPVLTWGSEEERAVVEQLVGHAGGRVVVWPRGTLPELVALLARATVVVGGDTGPIHIAAAVGTPTVSFYRVTDSRRNGPRGDRHILLQAPLKCSPCLRKECPDDSVCARSILADEVWSGISAVLSGESGSNDAADGPPSL